VVCKDGGVEQEEAKAIMLSIWDSKVKESMRIDLWTKDMPVDEMKIFFHQTLWPCLKLSNVLQMTKNG
jgi:gliding motility-associated protein GldC